MGRLVGRIPMTIFRNGLPLSALAASSMLVGQVVGGEAGMVLALAMAPTANAFAQCNSGQLRPAAGGVSHPSRRGKPGA